jgi:hypothetical protein
MADVIDTIVFIGACFIIADAGPSAPSTPIALCVMNKKIPT